VTDKSALAYGVGAIYMVAAKPYERGNAPAGDALRLKSVVGDKISVHVHPLRNGAAGAELMWVQKADGSTLGKTTEGAAP